MPGISVTSVDTAGGPINPSGNSHVYVKGNLVAVLGDPVSSHAPCPSISSHCAATMSQGSSFVFIKGIPVVIAGNSASCGHSATGRGFFQISS